MFQGFVLKRGRFFCKIDFCCHSDILLRFWLGVDVQCLVCAISSLHICQLYSERTLGYHERTKWSLRKVSADFAFIFGWYKLSVDFILKGKILTSDISVCLIDVTKLLGFHWTTNEEGKKKKSVSSVRGQLKKFSLFFLVCTT